MQVNSSFCVYSTLMIKYKAAIKQHIYTWSEYVKLSLLFSH